jgi:hypothetical protein
MLLVRNLVGIGPSKFQFQPCPKLAELGIDVAVDDVLQNFTKKETLTMDSNFKPWRGAREKDPRFLQMLIEASTFPNDIVVDCTAAIGNF